MVHKFYNKLLNLNKL